MEREEALTKAEYLKNQLKSLTETHQKAIDTLAKYTHANAELINAILANDQAKADSLRQKVKELRQDYFDITMVLLFNDTL